MTSTPDASPVEAPDARLLEAHDLARAALAEITPAATIGDAAGYTVEADGVVSLRFATRLGGYPGWFWTVSVAAAAPDAEPTVLEAELLPGEGALTAPDWVPWATRLADYQAAQAALALVGTDIEEELDLDEDDDDTDEDDDDLDEEDDDLDEEDDLDDGAPSDGSPILHAGDLDGVDIDELDDDAGDDLDDDDADDELDDDEADDDLDDSGPDEDLDDSGPDDDRGQPSA